MFIDARDNGSFLAYPKDDFGRVFCSFECLGSYHSPAVAARIERELRERHRSDQARERARRLWEETHKCPVCDGFPRLSGLGDIFEGERWEQPYCSRKCQDVARFRDSLCHFCGGSYGPAGSVQIAGKSFCSGNCAEEHQKEHQKWLKRQEERERRRGSNPFDALWF